MATLFGTSTPQTAQAPPETSLRIQTSVEGLPRSILWGQTRIAGNLVWYGDFSAIPATSPAATGGGKGGLFSSPSTTTSSGYNYSASLEVALCEGPIASIGPLMWAGKARTSLTAAGAATPPTILRTLDSYLGLTVANNGFAAFLGSALQAAWSYLTARHPGQDYTYRYTGYVAGNIQLGTNPSLPNWTFEARSLVSEATVAGSLVDADPTKVIADFLTNPTYGVPGWLTAYNGDWSNAQTYVFSADLLISYALTSQTTASSFLQELLTSINVDPVWSEATLKLVPRGDLLISGNGHTYSPPAAPIYDLTDADYLANQSSFGGTNADPVSCQQNAARNQNNVVKVEYLPRSGDYNPATVIAQDDGAILLFGERGNSGVKSWHWFQYAHAAYSAAHLALGREQILNRYSVTVKPRFILLDPGDIITLSDPALGLKRQWVKIKDVQENADRSLNILAEEYLQGTGAAPLFGATAGDGSRPNYFVDPGGINTPLIFEPTDELAGGLEIWAAVSGINQSLYGGSDAYVSYDGVNYARVPNGRQLGSARMGSLTAPLAPVAINLTGQTVDATNTLSVDLTMSAGVLASGTQIDALSLNTACWVDGEVIAYQTATLTGIDKYDLTYLVRGAFGTENAIVTHTIGASFVRLDSGILRIPFDQGRIGATIYLKFLPINIWGATVATLADVAPYTYVITGSALASPLPVVTNARTVFEAGFQKIWWDEVKDFRQSIRYLVKKGSSYQSAQTLGDLAHPPFVAFGDGVYWIVATCQPVAGLLVFSETPASITIAGSMLTKNVVETLDFRSLGWTGTLANIAKEGVDPTAFLRLDSTANILADPSVLINPDVLNAGGIARTGMWTSDIVVDAGYVADCSVNVSWLSVGQPVGADILSIADFLNAPDILASASSAFVNVFVEIRTASTSTLGVPDWGSWQRFVPGVYRCEFMQFRADFSTDSSAVIAYLLAMSAQISLPGRIDNYLGNNVSTSGLTIIFEPDDAISAKPFNGGPLVGGTNNHPLPAVSMSWPGLPTANYVIDAISLSQMTFHFIDSAGAPIAVNAVNVYVEGF